jgi:hypothetical protein
MLRLPQTFVCADGGGCPPSAFVCVEGPIYSERCAGPAARRAVSAAAGERMSVTGSRHLGTRASKTFIVGRAIGIASASLAGSRRPALRIAYEAAVRPAFIIVHAVLLRRCHGPPHPCGRSWRHGQSKCGKCDCRRDGYLADRLHNSLHDARAIAARQSFDRLVSARQTGPMDAWCDRELIIVDWLAGGGRDCSHKVAPLVQAVEIPAPRLPCGRCYCLLSQRCLLTELRLRETGRATEI